MGASLARAAHALGFTEAEIERLGLAYALAMEPRIRTLADDHHPAYLHPGRSPLVLLRDVGPVSLTTLVVATLHETEDEELRVAYAQVARELGEDVAARLESLPLPDDARLLERLVTLDEVARLAALAERLDQLRHAHLREDWRSRWRAMHEEAGAVWLPVAERTHPRLARRFRHWHRAFARRSRRA
jgi:hypothetical protein